MSVSVPKPWVSRHSGGLPSHALSVSLGAWQTHFSASIFSLVSSGPMSLSWCSCLFSARGPHPSSAGLVLRPSLEARPLLLGSSAWFSRPSLEARPLAHRSPPWPMPWDQRVCLSSAWKLYLWLRVLFLGKLPATRESRYGRFLLPPHTDTLPTQMYLKRLLPY